MAARPGHRGKVRLEIEGVKDELAQAARANLELQDFLDREVTVSQLRRLVTRGEQQIRGGLAPYGYYEAQAKGRLERQSGGWKLSYDVVPGAPYSVDDLLVLQQRLIDPDYSSLVSARPDIAKRRDRWGSAGHRTVPLAAAVPQLRRRPVQARRGRA